MEERVELGTFELKTGNVVVSDPCYDSIGGRINEPLENVKTGTWTAWVDRGDDGRIEALGAYIGNRQPFSEDYGWVSNDIGVDSGQAGIYERELYRDNDAVGKVANKLSFNIDEPGEKFYSANCDLTLGEEISGGVLPFGAVSSSGYGDGAYPLYTVVKDGFITAIKVVFIEDEEEEDEEDDEMEWCDDCEED